MVYVRFLLSLRQVEDLLHERGIGISHESERWPGSEARPHYRNLSPSMLQFTTISTMTAILKPELTSRPIAPPRWLSVVSLRHSRG